MLSVAVGCNIVCECSCGSGMTSIYISSSIGTEWMNVGKANVAVPDSLWK